MNESLSKLTTINERALIFLTAVLKVVTLHMSFSVTNHSAHTKLLVHSKSTTVLKGNHNELSKVDTFDYEHWISFY